MTDDSSRSADSVVLRDALSDPLSLSDEAVAAATRLPPLAAVHQLPAAEVDALAELWTSTRADSAATHPVLARLGPAAHRLRELRRAERTTTTCPVCCFDRLDEPPYLAFEGVPEAEGDRESLAPPYAIHFGDPSRRRCPCCGFGFGIDDDPVHGDETWTFQAWLRFWIERGASWHDSSRKPTQWTLAAQFAAAGRAEPAVTPTG
ncbi:hypothetical protein [Pseudonocardia endophytica]|nr:hypothetical protein [Pseudonocardia endophytica]